MNSPHDAGLVRGSPRWRDLCRQAREADQVVLGLRRQEREAIVELGRILFQLRPAFPYGAWEPFVSGELGIHVRRAQRALELYEQSRTDSTDKATLSRSVRVDASAQSGVRGVVGQGVAHAASDHLVPNGGVARDDEDLIWGAHEPVVSEFSDAERAQLIAMPNDGCTDDPEEQEPHTDDAGSSAPAPLSERVVAGVESPAAAFGSGGGAGQLTFEPLYLEFDSLDRQLRGALRRQAARGADAMRSFLDDLAAVVGRYA